MCDVCDTSPVDLGEVIPGLRLMRATKSSTYPDAYWAADEFALVEPDGNAVVVWSERSVTMVDPSFGLREDKVAALPSETLDVVDHSIEVNTEWVRHLRYVAGLRGSCRLLETITKSGWTEQDGDPEHYLACKVALALATHSLTQSEDK